MQVEEVSRLAVVQNEIGYGLSWIERYPCWLSSWAYSEGIFIEGEFILLGVGLEIRDAQSYFALLQEILARPNLLALDEATFLNRFRFTQ